MHTHHYDTIDVTDFWDPQQEVVITIYEHHSDSPRTGAPNGIAIQIYDSQLDMMVTFDLHANGKWSMR
jgi:hypothetical protein